MQGLWKDKRKHYLKDKGAAVYKRKIRTILNDDTGKEISDIFSRDVTFLYSYYQYKIKTYVCRVTIDEKFYIAKKVVNTINGRMQFYDFFSNKKIETERKLTGNGVVLKDYLIIKIHDEILINCETVINERVFDFDSNYMLYGKPFKWLDTKRYSSPSNRRKIVGKMISKSNRTQLRNYIIKSNWEDEIKQHPCTKSYKWLVY